MSDALSLTFTALADTTRRAILARLDRLNDYLQTLQAAPAKEETP